MSKPTIFVDADSCAALARDTIAHEAARADWEAVFVANRQIPLPPSGAILVLCGSQKDAADEVIASQAAAGDVVVTRDLLLASRLIERGAIVLNDKGYVFTREAMGGLLEERQLSLAMKELGVATGGKRKSYGKGELAAFRASLSSLLQHTGRGA